MTHGKTKMLVGNRKTQMGRIRRLITTGVRYQPYVSQAYKGTTQVLRKYDEYRKRQRTEPRGNAQGKTVNKLEGGVTTHFDSRTLYVKKKPNRRAIVRRKKTKQLANKLARVNQPTHTLLNSLISTSVVVQDIEFYAQQWKAMPIFEPDDLQKVCKHAAAISGTTEDPATTNAIVQSETDRLIATRVYMRHVSWELTMVQQEEPMTPATPMIVDIYYMQAKRRLNRDNYANLSGLLQSDISGNAGATISTDATTIGTDPDTYFARGYVSPYEHRELGKYFECYKKKQVQMSQGSVVTLSGVYQVNKNLGRHNWENLVADKGNTEFILISLRSADYNNAQVESETKGQQQLRMTKVFRFKVDINKNNPSLTTNTYAAV